MHGSHLHGTTSKLLLDNKSCENHIIYNEINELSHSLESLEVMEVIDALSREQIERSSDPKLKKTLLKGFIDIADLIVIALDCIDADIDATSKLAKYIERFQEENR